MNNNNKDTQYAEVTFKDTGDVYHFPLLGVRKVRDIVLKVSSLTTPLLGAGNDIRTEMLRNEEINKTYEEEGLEPPDDSISLFHLSTVFGEQLDNPSVQELTDKLMEGVLRNGQPYDPDKYYGDDEFSQYLMVMNESFKKNILNPLVKSLHQMGFSEIIGLVQAMMSNYLEARTKLNSKDSSTKEVQE